MTDKQRKELFEHDPFEEAQKQLKVEHDKQVIKKARENKRSKINQMKCKIQIDQYMEQHKLNQDQLSMIEKWISQVGNYENYWLYLNNDLLPIIEEQISNCPSLYEYHAGHGYVKIKSWYAKRSRIEAWIVCCTIYVVGGIIGTILLLSIGIIIYRANNWSIWFEDTFYGILGIFGV